MLIGVSVLFYLNIQRGRSRAGQAALVDEAADELWHIIAEEFGL